MSWSIYGKRKLLFSKRMLEGPETGGILRVVVPNLEGIVRNYIIALDKAAGRQRMGKSL